MKKLVITGSFIASLLISSLSFAAYTQTIEERTEAAGDFYMAVHGGISDFGKTRLDNVEIVGEFGNSGSMRYEMGYYGDLVYGYHFDPACIRTEGQLMFARVPLKSVFVAGKGDQRLTGSFQIISLMLNATYEFTNIGANAHPYFGLGVGLNHLRFLPSSITDPFGFTTTGLSSLSTNRFGYQLIVGLLIHKKEGFAVDIHYMNKSIMAVPYVKGNLSTQHFGVGINFDIGDDM